MLDRLLHLPDRAAQGLGLLDRDFDISALLQAALRRGQADKFEDVSFRPALERLLESCAREAELGVFGRLALRWDVLRFLGNRLRLEAAERADPTIVAAPVTAPIFITGLPRSGTSFLHGVLCQDADNMVPRNWQTVFPYPISGEAAGETARRRARTDRQLRLFARLAPGFTPLHPIDADSPIECSEITGHSFASLRFDTTHRIPGYLAWLDGAGHGAAYRYHRRFLQHLQHQMPGSANRRWVVKCPDHLFALDDIRAVYRDARFVFVHRDPLHVLASVARLTEVLRAPFARRMDRHEIGRQVADRWVLGARVMLEAASDPRICHLHHDRLIADPVGTIAGMYAHFGLTLSAEARAAMAAFVTAAPDGGYGRNQYDPRDYGLDVAEERRRFGDYIAEFEINMARGAMPLAAD